jgi:hypothetical protein
MRESKERTTRVRPKQKVSELEMLRFWAYEISIASRNDESFLGIH